MKLKRELRPRRAQGRGRPQQRQHLHQAGPGLGAEHAAARRAWPPPTPGSPSSTPCARPASGSSRADDRDRVERPRQRPRPWPRPASRRSSAASPTGSRWPGAGSTSPSCHRWTRIRPARWSWSRCEPTVRYMDRCGMATGTRAGGQRLWGDALPADRRPADLVRELYAAENAGLSRTVRLAGHVRPHLPGHQPPRLRRLDRRWLVPRPRRVHQRPDGRGLAGAGHPPGPGRRAPGGLRAPRRQAAGPSLDRPPRRQRPCLLRRHPGHGRGRARRIAQRVLPRLGRHPAADLRASHHQDRPARPPGSLCRRVPRGDVLRVRRRLPHRGLRGATRLAPLRISVRS